MSILAIDPGTDKSAFVIWDGSRVHECGILDNLDLLRKIAFGEFRAYSAAIEMIASYGMPVGREVFETCVWIGRFVERLGHVKLIYRKDVKLAICGSPRAKDANIRAALIDRLGQVGTKNNPGPLYGMKSHLWAALAVAVTAQEAEK
jgi:hypothetical protein